MSDSPVTKLSLTEAVIAHLLKQSATPLFGLELVRRSPPDIQLKKGTIYVTLERMEKKGLLTSELEVEPPPDLVKGAYYVPRRMYTLTLKGLQALSATQEKIARFHSFLVEP